MIIEQVETSLAKIKPAEERLTGWKGVLVPIFNWEMTTLKELQLISSTIDDYIIENPTVENIKQLKSIEDKLTEVKKLSSRSNKERLDLFANINDLSKRLMIPEKEYESIAKKISDTFIKIKRLENTEREKVQKRQEDLAAFRSKVQTKLNNDINNWNLYIESKITDVYKDALDLIEVEDLTNYTNDILWKHTEKEFQFSSMSLTKWELEDKEKMAIFKEIANTWDSKSFSDKFAEKIKATFSDFEVAKSQKEAALKIRQNEAEIEVDAANENLEMETALVQIEEKVVVQDNLFEVTKNLKKVYEIDMEHNEKNMVIIEKAFYGNRQDCLSMYQGKDCWKINTEDKGNLLCRIKNRDNKFAPDGVVFKEIEKI